VVGAVLARDLPRVGIVQPPRDSARTVRIALILCVAAIPRIWAAVWDHGIFWPDEIFQSLEQAHRFAFGYGFVAWEFQDGARSWLFPGVLGLFWKVVALFGMNAAPALVISAKLAMVVLALIGIYASMRIAERLGGGDAAILCGVLGAFLPPLIVYGSRCMTEMASAPLCALAVLLLLDTARWKVVLAGCLAALAVFLRYQNGVIAAALLGVLIVQQRHRDAMRYAAGALMIGFLGGMLDLFTWGTPFHSFVAYVRFNLVEGRSAAFGVEPPDYYIETLWSAVGWPSIAVAAGLAASASRAPALLAVVLLYIVAHTFVGHKELRFLMPVVPLALALSGIGLARLIERMVHPPAPPGTRERQRHRHARRQPRRDVAPTLSVRNATWALAAVLGGAMAWHTAHATFDDFGQRRGPLSGQHSVWHTVEDVNRLLWHAGAQPDLCGLALVGYGPIWTGGYTYLHRDVPILWGPSIETGAANYALAPTTFEVPGDFRTIATIGEAKLVRRPGDCGTPPEGYTRVFPK